MNAKKQQRINEAMKLLSPQYRTTPYDPKINSHNTIEHELSKCKVIYDLKKRGKVVYAEAIFNNGARADIFIPEDYQVIEILHSETQAEALSKEEYYPFSLDLIFKTTEEILNDKFI